MRKKIALIAVVLLLLSLITGCGGKKKAVAPWEEIKNLKPAKLRFFIPAQNHFRLEAILEELEKKALDKLNVELEFVGTDNWDLHKNLVINAVNSGEKIDAFYTEPWYMYDFIKEGVVADITQLFPRYAPSYFTQITKDQLEQVTYDGKIMAIPVNSMPWTNRYCVIARADLLEKYKIKSISNFDEFEKFLETIKKNEPKLIPACLNINSLDLFAEANGYTVFDYNLALVYKKGDPKIKLLPWESTPVYKECIERLNNWKTNGFIVQNQIGSWSMYENEIASGHYASFLGGPGDSLELNDILKKQGKSFEYKEFDLYPDVKYSKQLNSYGLAFCSQSPDIERAIMFVEWLQSEQKNYDLLMYGIEGEDYVRDANNKPVLPEDANPDYAYMNWWGKGVFYNYERDYMDENYKKLRLRVLDKYCEFPMHHGFNFKKDDFYIDRNSLGNKRLDVFLPEDQIFDGNFSIDKLNDMIENQKPIVQEIISILQKEVDQWLVSKGR